MDIKRIIKSQYLACLEMLKEAITRCPGALWDDQEHANRFWHVCYHVLFYTHLYLQDREEEFVPWTKHRNEYPFLGSLPWPPHREPDIGEPYSKEDILEYLEVCRNEVEQRVDRMDPDAESGFGWLPFNNLELQFYNIRHIQHHTGQLIDRLRTKADIGIDWVGMKPE
jgi:hypothetical protein